MTSEPLDLDGNAVVRDIDELIGERNAMVNVVNRQAEQIVEARAELLDARRRAEQAEHAVARVREYATAWRHETWARGVLRVLEGGDDDG